VANQLPAAVLWDQDGTLIDTEPYWIAAEFELVAEHGGSWSHEQALQLVGNSLPESARIIKAAGVRLPMPDILEYLIDRVIASIRQSMPWRPGVHELLLELKAAGIPTALVTASYRRLAAEVAAQSGGLIDVVVAGDDLVPDNVGQGAGITASEAGAKRAIKGKPDSAHLRAIRGKPDAEPYLRAAELLGVSITDCIAIEDSPNGISSAMASGAKTIGVPCMVPIPDREGLEVVDSVADLDVASIWGPFSASP
jgi:beta-phosphoglucomutase-like phosphatase (HAD superfamily)